MSKRRSDLKLSAVGGEERARRARVAAPALIAIVVLVLVILASTAVASQKETPLPPGGGTAVPWVTGGPLNDVLDPSGRAASAPQTRVPGHYIVVLEDSVAHPGAVAEAQTDLADGELGLVFRHALKGYSAELSKDAVDELRDDPRVKYVAPDRKIEAQSQTTPTGVSRIRADKLAALDIDEVDDVRVNADVAVIDTGVDPTHPDLNVFKRTDCVPANPEEWEAEACVDNTGTDGYGHGTHVAGIVGAIDNNKGVVGVAPGARIWAVKVLGNEGLGYESWIVAGVDWVTAHASEIEVANMSLGCACSQPALEEAIDASVEAGVVYAVAAGNESANASEFSPAVNPNVITVSSLDDSDGLPGGEGPGTCFNDAWGENEEVADDALAFYSNWGPAVDLAAPGTCILSTVPLGGSHVSSSPSAEYAAISGTSMAAPHVAGAAAILAAASNPNSKKDVEAIRLQLEEEGSYDWEDTSPDGVQEPLLDIGPAATEAVTTRGLGVSHGVTFKGIVNPGGVETSYTFEYGLTTSYGQSLPASPKSVGSGVKAVKVSQTFGELKADAGPYHYRIAATNAKGTIYGKDRTVSPTRWTVQSTPGASGAEGDNSAFTDVSCASAKECMAVGVREVEATHSVYPYVKRWNEGSWSTISAPSAGEPRGVDCISTIECFAVGNNHGKEALSVEAWNWHINKWTRMTVPMPAEASSANLESVSCRSWAECVAVGTYVPKAAGTEYRTLVEVWDGTKWTVQSSPNPENALRSSLGDVSCNSNGCIAVGSYQDKEGFILPLTERWDGSSWSLQSPAMPGVGPWEMGWWFIPSSVSCIEGKNRCTMVGYNYDETGYHPLVGTWDGSEWSLEALGGQGWLTDASCTSSRSCDAIGYDYNGVIGRHWNGSVWVADDLVPSSESPEYELTGLSCSASYECTVAGFRRGGATEFDPMAQRSMPAPSADSLAATALNTKEATLNGTVNPNGFATTYQIEYGSTTAYGSVVPASPKSVGSGTSPVAVSQTVSGLAEGNYHFRVVASSSEGTTYSGDREFSTTKWKNQEPPALGGTETAELNEVSCASKEACMAVGAGYTEFGGLEPISESWNGSNWTRHSLPVPTEPGYTYTELQDVSCFSASECMAVGSYSDEESYGGLSESWNGTKWSLQTVPKPSGSQQSALTGVSCPAKESCIGAGWYQPEVSGPAMPMVASWNGTKWTIQSFVPPAGTINGMFNAVSCSAVNACVAVGFYGESGGGGGALAVRWNGTAWSIANSGLNAKAWLSDVSCLSATHCKVVGGNLLQTWNGSSWSSTTLPLQGSGWGGLASISCSSAEACTAVGSYQDSAGEYRSFADVWNGSTWSVDPMNQPPGESVISSAGGVSCTAPSTCTAVGWTVGTTGSLELIQRRLP